MVVHRAECRPVVNDNYMKLKKLQIEESTKPQRASQQLERAVTTIFKPVANHDFNCFELEPLELCLIVSFGSVHFTEAEAPQCGPCGGSARCQVTARFYRGSLMVEYEKKKKSEGKMVRAERQVVLDMLFSAFEKHQYYNIKDLVDITRQPVTYLKEIMREIGTYNSKGAHKSTWELKPEYRHYQSAEEEEEMQAA
ncbi:hypothetical protein INR49_025153 [Caranx melampygus]|nr:hypothetical protein INR49_025153 [Caranx melampygus]